LNQKEKTQQQKNTKNRAAYVHVWLTAGFCPSVQALSELLFVKSYL